MNREYLLPETRLKVYHQIHDYLAKNVDSQMFQNCFSFNENSQSTTDLTTVLKVLRRIGSKSLYGEAYEVVTKDRHKNRAAMKILPIAPDNTVNNMGWWASEVMKELNIVIEFNKKFEKDLFYCPNLPMMYALYFCDQCKYQNVALTKGKAPQKCAIFINELASGDYNSWIKQPGKHSELENKSSIFQVLAGICAIEEDFGMIHDDLHPGNYLFTNVPKGGYWHYRYVMSQVNGKKQTFDYYVPNTGQMWKLWDFGFARAVGSKSNPRDLFDMFEKDVDYSIGYCMADYPKAKVQGNIRKDVGYALDYADSRIKSRVSAVPAFEALVVLGNSWFAKKPPQNQVINKKPFLLKVKEHKLSLR
jgi:serine/threonine protein kinase